ncbi:ACSL [Lepeophtheirus salmonis]|uniref:long-chain-fatty-acid--CoA ligase n=1 Tax=Lepeophtheirus salmonis TaxID=72036 RepID=A0A7R8H9U1_LEPSM|nr:ACSL [Lepeophtheirus salmonis]CAF2960710.1 ACSL [Lepeophtheirus salmonis]
MRRRKSKDDEDLESIPPDAGLVGNLGLGVIKTLIYVYDFLTYPIYAAIQRPWEVREASNALRSRPISKSDSEITYAPVYRSTERLDAFFRAAGVDNMLDCWKLAVSLHGDKDCLGTRHVLEEKDEVQPDGKVFKKWAMGEYQWKSFNEIEELSTDFGKGLRELGLETKENICIFAESKAEWMISALGCFKQTFPLVTLYANLGEDAIAHGVNQTQVSHLITTHDLLPKLKNVLERTPSIKYIIFFEDQLNATDRSGYKSGVRILSFQEVIELGSKSETKATPPTKDDPAIIMYTSGSTGVPKGVILPHESLIGTIAAFHLVVKDKIPEETYLGYLPLAHIYELLAEMTMLIHGIKVGYSSPNTMIDKSTKVMKGSKGDCSVLRPTLMCAVPLVIDRIYKGIHENLSKKKRLGMRTPIMNALIFRPMRAIVGGKVRVIVSGGAPLSHNIHDYVSCALDIPIHQGYGLTESCAGGSVMHREELSTGRVGPPGQGVLIRLINWEDGGYRVTDKPRPRGEIVIGGPNIAHGGLKTGDVGEFAEDGTLKIIDRKKDLVKLQYGEYVSLGKVETVIKTCPLVENVCAYGDPTKSYCVALVVPDRNKLTELGESIGIYNASLEDLCMNEKVIATMQKETASYGRKNGLEKFEVPGAITLCTEMWTPESGLVTAAFKLRRKPIQDFYQKELKKMYETRRT